MIPALAAATAGAVWTGVADAAVSPARARALTAATVGLGVPLSPSVPPVAPGAVLTAFSDPAGDDLAGRAPDILETSVWSDAAGVVTVRAEIPGVPELRPGDLYALFLDTDLDRTTGNPYAGGADAVIAELERVFRSHHAPLCGFLSRYVAAAEAEELVQETFLRLWNDRQSLAVHTSLRAYLYASARNRALNHLKRQGVEQRWAQAEAQGLTDHVDPEGPRLVEAAESSRRGR